jgi:hypothetical protein
MRAATATGSRAGLKKGQSRIPRTERLIIWLQVNPLAQRHNRLSLPEANLDLKDNRLEQLSAVKAIDLDSDDGDAWAFESVVVVSLNGRRVCDAAGGCWPK